MELIKHIAANLASKRTKGWGVFISSNYICMKMAIEERGNGCFSDYDSWKILGPTT